MATPATPAPAVLSPDELAAELRVSRATIYRMLRRRAIDSVRVGGQIRIPRRAVDALFEHEKQED